MGARVTIISMVILLLFAAVPWSCHKETEKDRVAKVITAIQKAAENKEIKNILPHLSKAYRDPQGNDYQGVKDILLFYFFRHRNISVFVANLDINIQAASATALFEALLSARAGSDGAILPEALGEYRFAVVLTKEAGEWKVSSAKWERFGDDLTKSSPES